VKIEKNQIFNPQTSFSAHKNLITQDDWFIEHILLSPILSSREPEEPTKTTKFFKESQLPNFFSFDAFIDWFVANIPFQLLFQLLFNRLFLPSAAQSVRQLRYDNLLSPLIISSNPISNFS